MRESACASPDLALRSAERSIGSWWKVDEAVSQAARCRPWQSCPGTFGSLILQYNTNRAFWHVNF